MPLEFADLEWSKFVLESLCCSYSRGFADVEPLIDEEDMDAGTVKFETQGNRLVRVTVELDYVPRTTDTAAEEIARAEGTLRRDLENPPPTRPSRPGSGQPRLRPAQGLGSGPPRPPSFPVCGLLQRDPLSADSVAPAGAPPARSRVPATC